MKQAARKFREFWTLAKDSEVGGYQKFWISLLGDVLRMEDVMSRISFQSPEQLKDTTKYLDAWIPETKVLIEHKARGIKLDAPQSGHGGKTPYEQALDYNIARPFSEKARWIVTSNFDEIWVYDMDHPLDDPQKISLADLPKEVSRLGFLVDSQVKSVREKEKDISIKAGRIVGELYRELLKRYAEPNSSETLKHLNRLCVRLVFLFYAEDAELFPKDAFWTLLKNTPAAFLRQRLLTLFRVLDTPDGSNGTKNERDPYLEPEIAAFPYTNGGLFKNVADAEVPPLDDDIKEMLVKASNFDWRDISPTIFGALFESTLNPETRRAGGMVYTSVENIHKVIDPLFMSDLAAELEAIKSERAIAVRRAKAVAFQEKLGSFKFLDPACGSGNFLTETFISLRKLENEAIVVGERLKPGEVLLNIDGIVKVSIKQFHGIEINDFAVSVAKTAMWISEAKMLNETANILHAPPKYLPLQDYDGIIEGNALRMDWPEADYIMGNPPFVGASMMSAEQKAEAVSIFGKRRRTNSIDYVGAWYYKAIQVKGAKCAFVSTNSITQGEQVSPMWQPLFEQGLEIDFAWRTFRWDNESFDKAHVHCVIVGFHCDRELLSLRGDSESRSPGEDSKNLQNSKTPSSESKIIFGGDKATPAVNICPYLIDAPTVFIESRATPLCEVPRMTYGNKPTDDGNLILSETERDAILRETPELEQYILRYVGSRDFINSDEVRYCLWLKDASPTICRKNRDVMRRLAAVREFRLASSAAPTRKMAEQPWRFFSTPQTGSRYLLVPEVSSERRRYVPVGFMEPSVIAANTVSIIPSATLYHFGVLTSSLHMAWMRAVAGRLKSDYRYSAAIVYNNFPWPVVDTTEYTEDTEKKKITQTAQAILDARAKYPDSSLADLYDPLTMPPELRAAHAANDRAVLAAYGLAPDTPESAIVAHLFKLYAEMTKKGANA